MKDTDPVDLVQLDSPELLVRRRTVHGGLSLVRAGLRPLGLLLALRIRLHSPGLPAGLGHLGDVVVRLPLRTELHLLDRLLLRPARLRNQTRLLGLPARLHLLLRPLVGARLNVIRAGLRPLGLLLVLRTGLHSLLRRLSLVPAGLRFPIRLLFSARLHLLVRLLDTGRLHLLRARLSLVPAGLRFPIRLLFSARLHLLVRLLDTGRF
ncbi:hypothetical protein [Streptomyces sp. NPDC001340]